MIKYLVLGSLLLLTTACSEPEMKQLDRQQVAQQLKLHNEFLQPSESQVAINEDLLVQALPFTESYLIKRHAIYNSLRGLDLSPTEQKLADYLTIAERFPARYFPWPAHIDVVEHMLHRDISQQKIAEWVDFTADQLTLGLQSKLKLNKIELAALKAQLTALEDREGFSSVLIESLDSLTRYLEDYTPRGSIGLHGLPNGGPWYQSKLNYFAGTTDAPLNWLVKVQSQFTKLEAQTLKLPVELEHNHSLVEQWLGKQSMALAKGLDWQQGYYNLPVTASRHIKQMSESDKAFWLAMMETDLGVHYHAWTSQQAKVNLINRLNISPQQAQFLVADIIFYPAFSFSFAPVLKMTN